MLIATILSMGLQVSLHPGIDAAKRRMLNWEYPKLYYTAWSFKITQKGHHFGINLQLGIIVGPIGMVTEQLAILVTFICIYDDYILLSSVFYIHAM